MTDIPVTQADRDAAADVYAISAPVFSEGIRSGEIELRLVEAFARHRQQAEQETLERAAKVADAAAVNRDNIAARHHDYTARYHNECRAMEAREIAAAIRAMQTGESQ